MELVDIFLEWIKNRWIVAAVVFVLIVAVVTMIILLLCQPRHGAYTNAWYVMHYI